MIKITYIHPITEVVTIQLMGMLMVSDPSAPEGGDDPNDPWHSSPGRRPF